MGTSADRGQRPGDGSGGGQGGEGPPAEAEAPLFGGYVTRDQLAQALDRWGRSLAEVLLELGDPEAEAEAEGGQSEGPPQDTPEAGEPEAEAVAVPHQAAAGYPGAVVEHPSGECAWCDALRWRERIRIDGAWR